MNNEEKDVNEDTEVFVCYECDDEFKKKNELTEANNGNLYCSGCYEDNFFHCEDCGNEEHNDNGYNANSSHSWSSHQVCEDCYNENYFVCEYCDETVPAGDSCENCDENGSLPERDYYSGDNFVVNGKRAFSCEVECYYPSMKVMREVAKEIPNEFGITSDGSLDDMGVEFNTPKLSGARGEKLLEEFTSTLLENDFTVNSSCGLHIHLDGKDVLRTTFAVQKLMIFFMIYEDVIMSFLPASRRDNNYCLPLSDFYHLQEIKNAMSIESLETIWYREQSKMAREERKKDRHDRSRYAGINFHSLLANGHLEIRYHSGTINYDKIINWIKLFVRIMDKVVQSCNEGRFENKLHLTTLLKTKFTLGLPEKTKSFFDMIDLPESEQAYFLKRQKKFTGDASEE